MWEKKGEGIFFENKKGEEAKPLNPNKGRNIHDSDRRPIQGVAAG